MKPKLFILIIITFLFTGCFKGEEQIYHGKRSYSKDGKNTVKDNLTGLIWQKTGSKNSMNLNDAKKYCSSLSLDTYTNWRLASFNELYYLADRTKINPAIDEKYFEESGDWYWSSTTKSSDSSKAWVVNFDSGFSNNISILSNYSVRCVR